MQAFDSEHPSSPVLNMQTVSNPWSIRWPLPARPEDADDELLLYYIHEGSESDSRRAVETLFLRHHQDVWRYVRSRVSSAADADEISSAVWLVVLEKIYNFVWTGAPIKSWVFSIAHRKIREFFNNPPALSLETLAEQREEALHYIAGQLSLIDPPAARVSSTIKKEADVLLHRLIAGLSDVERQIIILIYFENLENATEVAARLGMNKNTIRVYHKRARDKLRACAELRSLFEGTA